MALQLPALISNGQWKALDPGAGLAAASLPEPAATATSAFLGLAGLSPSDGEGELSSGLYHLVSLPKGCE